VHEATGMNEQDLDGSAPPTIWPYRIDIAGRLVNPPARRPREMHVAVHEDSPRASIAFSSVGPRRRQPDPRGHRSPSTVRSQRNHGSICPALQKDARGRAQRVAGLARRYDEPTAVEVGQIVDPAKGGPVHALETAEQGFLAVDCRRVTGNCRARLA